MRPVPMASPNTLMAVRNVSNAQSAVRIMITVSRARTKVTSLA